jgi:hypothetical protein
MNNFLRHLAALFYPPRTRRYQRNLLIDAFNSAVLLAITVLLWTVVPLAVLEDLGWVNHKCQPCTRDHCPAPSIHGSPQAISLAATNSWVAERARTRELLRRKLMP